MIKVILTIIIIYFYGLTPMAFSYGVQENNSVQSVYPHPFSISTPRNSMVIVNAINPVDATSVTIQSLPVHGFYQGAMSGTYEVHENE